jgi:hypothetical protein
MVRFHTRYTRLAGRYTIPAMLDSSQTPRHKCTVAYGDDATPLKTRDRRDAAGVRTRRCRLQM